ncbi:MAG TPA: pitrilysin family protein [Anaerolineae bacterium]|nr:pitrilysin family protein [Anaerolineae bacterium]
MPTPTVYPGPHNIHRHQFANGLTLLVYENHSVPVAVVEGILRAGSVTDVRAQAGLSNLATMMLTRGTKRYSFKQLYELLETMNASLYMSSELHFTSFGTSGLREDLPTLLDLLADCIQQPVFPQPQFERLKTQTLTGLKMRDNDTRAQASLAFYDEMYGEHPYAQSVLGYPHSLADIGVADLQSYYDRFYGPEGMIIVVVGDVTEGQVYDLVAEKFGRWARAGQEAMPAMPPAPMPVGHQRVHVPMPHKSQTDVLLGLPVIPRQHSDYLLLSVMNTILGVFGMMGRLGQNVREEQGLAYYIESNLEGDFGPLPWSVSTGVAPENVEKTIETVLVEIDKMQNSLVPDWELADTVAYRMGGLPVSLETNYGLAANILNLEMFDLGLDYFQKYRTVLSAISPEQVQMIAQKYLSTENLVIASAGPE